MASRLKRGLIAVPLGLVLGGALVFAVGMALPNFIAIHDDAGSYEMAVAFFLTPVGAVVGAIIGLIVALARRR